ncbi:MAG: RagB/SusD family nutrient uptake outer membrane protein [Bacteroidales bacterium]|nr:RagB/SusD family nutrient uptake outer membrane protein [Bacteroidales bacterium]
MLSGCYGFLKEEVYTEYDPSQVLKDEEGVNALLAGAYSKSRMVGYNSRNFTYMMNEFCTDIAFETGGGLEASCTPYINFTWGINDQFLDTHWRNMYSAISSANSVLSVTKSLTGVPEETIAKIQGEARFIRASSYYYLYTIFGTTPIIEIPEGATPEEIETIGNSTPRAEKSDFVNYIIKDLEFAAANLPVVEDPIGRATKGAALALLTKLYMHETDWANAQNTAKKVVELNHYSLSDDYAKMFSVEGENNLEYIYRAPCLPVSGYHNNYMAHALPPKYPTLLPYDNFGAQFRTYTAFYETFEDGDKRRECFVTHYINTDGEEVELLRDTVTRDPLDNVRSFKYALDPNGTGELHGNDIVLIRYADILLCLAEADNELNGPTQTGLDYINAVRDRAGLEHWKLIDYTTKDELRDSILAERGREFFSEGLRREDLIRHGKFISNARKRGKDAQEYHVLYPIPLSQLQTNPKLVQNPGYQSAPAQQ